MAYDIPPMVDQGASTRILFAEFWSSEDPEKSAPWSPALNDATHQPEVAVPQLFIANIVAAASTMMAHLIIAAFLMCSPNCWTSQLHSAQVQAKALSCSLLGEPARFLDLVN